MTRRPAVCEGIEPDLLASAMGEAGPEAVERVEAHVERCRSCRQDFERYREIEGAVAGLRTEPAPAGALAASREQLESRLLDLRSRLLTYRIVPSPFGDILIARSELGVALVEYLGRGGAIRGVRLGRRGGVEMIEDGGDLAEMGQELAAYLGGRQRRLAWPVDLRLARSDFHRAVLQQTAAIPPGAVVSYKSLAGQLGRPEAVRAVAQALRWNPVPIVVPCHRVVGATGALVGYAGGPPTRKEQLLSIEGVPIRHTRADGMVCRDLMYVLEPGGTEYCLPSCSPTMGLATGATLFGSREQAEAQGLLPCTTCRPDVHPLVGPLTLA
ncbi:MAG TPA: methylated-DNA--[protein]-cysteine S-methyltransferase [Methylomirabilota bacterium]|nr:methylated-DNA--[protein]-cysteine S-methyltransferase [Methylomirabilota bacterium]